MIKVPVFKVVVEKRRLNHIFSLFEKPPQIVEQMTAFNIGVLGIPNCENEK